MARLGSGLETKVFANEKPAEVVEPKHIPGGTQFFDLGTDEVFHFFFPATGIEQPTITDFNGFIGSVSVGGTAKGTNTVTGETNQFFFGLDNRFMKGTYIGIDGEAHQAAFYAGLRPLCGKCGRY